MKVHPVFGGSIAGKSLVVTAQRRLNCYYENRPDKDKSPIAVYGTPGMRLQFALGAQVSPLRGAIGTKTNLYSAIGNAFLVSSPQGVISTNLPNLNTRAGLVSFAINPTQVLVVDGTNGYIFASGALTQIAAAGFPNGAQTATMLDLYFIVEIPGTQQFAVSGFSDGTTWSALSYASAASYQDVTMAVDSYQSTLLVFCSLHIEFWQNVGATPQPFAPIKSATREWGLAAVFSRAHAADTVLFLAASPQGGYSVCQITGFDVKPVSTPDLDYIFSTFATVSDATALTYRADQHTFYQLTFPTANRSFIYDCTTGMWGETQSGTTPGYAKRHLGNLSVNVAGIQLISDFANNNLYVPDPATYQDNGQTLPRLIVTKHHTRDFNVFSVDELYLDMETGVGLVAGQGSNPQLQVTCSKNDGRTPGTPRLTPLGALGNYGRMPPLRRWGSARTFTWSLYMTDPVKFAMTAAAFTERMREQGE